MDNIDEFFIININKVVCCSLGLGSQIEIILDNGISIYVENYIGENGKSRFNKLKEVISLKKAVCLTPQLENNDT